MSETYLVRVSGVAAGILADHGGYTAFQLLDAYRDNPARPVLGQAFEDEPDRVWRHNNRAPAWFANLLPEGELRDFLARQLLVSNARDAPFLAAIGADLPGAATVEVFDDAITLDAEIPPAEPVPHDEDPTGVRFSVAGYQLKLSMLHKGERGLTLPGRGELGNHIVKLPSPHFPDVPTNEFVMMSWAASVGIDVPDVGLVDLDTLDLPVGLGEFRERTAYIVRRFDRGEGDQRVHIEDFNQVLSQWPGEKYRGAAYESLGALIDATTGSPDAVAEYIRRLVFVIAIGNEDAHLKNWSLIYPNGRAAALSPAYDLVSTITYDGLARGLGLNLDRSKAFDRISSNSFNRMARRLEHRAELIHSTVEVTVASILATIDEFAPRLDGRESALRRHLQRIPLFNGK